MRVKVVFLIWISVGCVYGQYRQLPEVVTKVATAAGNWLKIETSARAIGMGGAYVAAGEGVSAIPYNASGIAFLRGREVYYTQTQYLAGITHGVLGYGQRLSGSDYVGVHLFYLDSGPMDVTTESYPDGTGEEFKVQSISLRIVYGRRMTDRLKVGLGLNYIRDAIELTRMQTVAFDIGSNFETGIYGFRLGMSVSNFGPEVQYHGSGLERVVPDTLDVDRRLSRVTEPFPLPLIFRLGVRNEVVGRESEWIRSRRHRLILVADGINASDYTVYGSLGMEYSYGDLLYVRVGDHVGHDTAGLSIGGGLKFRAGSMGLVVDYAWVNYGVLKTTQQLGVNLNF